MALRKLTLATWSVVMGITVCSLSCEDSLAGSQPPIVPDPARVAPMAQQYAGPSTVGQKAGPAHFSWSLEVVYPDNEKKTFVVNSGEGQIALKDSSWVCFYGERMEKYFPTGEAAQMRSLTCANTMGSLSSSVACVAFPGRQTETHLLNIENANPANTARHQIILKCKAD